MFMYVKRFPKTWRAVLVESKEIVAWGGARLLIFYYTYLGQVRNIDQMSALQNGLVDRMVKTGNGIVSFMISLFRRFCFICSVGLRVSLFPSEQYIEKYWQRSDSEERHRAEFFVNIHEFWYLLKSCNDQTTAFRAISNPFWIKTSEKCVLFTRNINQIIFAKIGHSGNYKKSLVSVQMKLFEFWT